MFTLIDIHLDSSEETPVKSADFYQQQPISNLDPERTVSSSLPVLQ